MARRRTGCTMTARGVSFGLNPSLFPFMLHMFDIKYVKSCLLEPFLHTLSVICRGAVPRYLAYEHVKVRVPGPRWTPPAGAQDAHLLLAARSGLPRRTRFSCPAGQPRCTSKPVRGAERAAQVHLPRGETSIKLLPPALLFWKEKKMKNCCYIFSKYVCGLWQTALKACHRPSLSCLVQAFTEDLGKTKKLKLHIVGAVYGAKRAWADEHGGEEPPPHVVRLFTFCSCCQYNDVFLAGIMTGMSTSRLSSQSFVGPGPAGGCLGGAAGLSLAGGAHQPAAELQPPLPDAGVGLGQQAPACVRGGGAEEAGQRHPAARRQLGTAAAPRGVAGYRLAAAGRRLLSRRRQ